MKKILILALVLMSAKLLAIELPKDTLWSLQTGKFWFNNAIFSYDDKKIYANTRVGVLVLDAQKGDSLDFIDGINIGRESLDGSYFMSIHPKDIRTKDNNVEKYDSQTRQKIWTCPKREKDDLLFVAFSQNAKYVLLIYSNTNLDIYNTETQELVKSLHYNTFAWLDNGFAIDNNGEKILVTAPIIKDMKFGEVSYLINAVSGEIIKEMYFAEGIQLNQSAMFSAQNNFALAKWQIYSSVLNLRNMDSFVYAPTGGISHLLGIISPDEKYLVSGGAKIGSVELYDIKNKKIIYTADKITNTNGNVGYGDISKKNEMLLLGFTNQIFNIGLSLTGVNNTTNTNEVVYPNPTNGQLQINVSITIPTQIYASITDISGKNVKNINLGFYEAGNISIPINVVDIPNGNYVLTLNGNNLTKTFKLIKE